MDRSSVEGHGLAAAARKARRFLTGIDRSQLSSASFALGLTLVVALMHSMFQPAGLAFLWPLAGVAVGLMSIATRASRGPVALGLVSGLLLAALVERRSAVPTLVPFIATVIEAGLAGAFLGRIADGSFALDRWRSVAAFIVVALLAPALAWMPVTLAMQLADGAGDADAVGSWSSLWWASAGPHVLGILTVAPAVIGLDRFVSPRLGRLEPVSVLVGALIILVIVGDSPLGGTDTAALLLLLLTPIVGWSLLHANPASLAMALLAVGAVALRHASYDTGIFADARITGQLLVAVGAIALLFFGTGRDARGASASPHDRSLRQQNDIRAAVVLAPILLFAFAGWWAFFDVETDAKARGARKLDALVEHAHRVIEVQEAMLDAVLARISGRSFDEIATEASLTAFLNQLVAGTDTSKALFVAHLDTGRVLASSLGFPAPDLDHSRRDYIRTHREKTLRTVIGEVGQALPHVDYGFTVSRLDSKSGLVAVSLLSFDEFQRFYTQMREGDHDVINLLRDDGALLARQFLQASTPGMRLPAQAISMRLIRAELAGPVVGREISDGVTRQFQARKVASYPVFVAYGQDYARVRAGWLRALVPIGLLALLTSAMLNRLTHRLQRTAAEAEAARVAARSQRSLSEMNDRFSFAMRAAGAGAWELEPGTDRGTWSPECFGLFGVDVADGVPTLSQWRAQVVHPDDLVHVQNEAEALLSGRVITIQYDFRILHPRHGLRWISTHGQLKRTDGMPPRIVGLSIDITERKRTEAALRESEERLRLSIEAAGIGTFSIDLLTGRVEYSLELAEMLGFPGLSGATLDAALARVHRDDFSRVKAQLDAAIAPASDGRLKMELRFVRPGGVVRWMTWNGRVTFQELPQGRRAVRVLGACTDITERKLAEEKLGASEARFRSLVALSSDWYWEQDEHFRFVDVSDPVEDLAGSTVGSHLGKTRWELPAVGMTEEKWAVHRAQLERHEPFRNLEYRRINERGEIIWMAVNGDPVFDDAGHFKGYRGTGHNITVRREAEEALRTSEGRMRLAARAAGIGFWELDLASGTVRGSPEYFTLFGMEPTSEPVPVERFWEKYHPSDRARMQAEGNDVGWPTLDRRIVLPDGQVRWVHVARDVRRDATGTPVTRHGATIDVTERKQAEQVLSEARAELERRVDERTADLQLEMQKREDVQAKLAQVRRLDAVGRLTGGLAHDFNNALAVISANIELAQPHIQDAKARRGLQVALDVVEMSASLNRRLLTFTRGGKFKAERVCVNEHVYGIAGLLEKTLGGNAVVDTNLSPETWPARLDAGELTSAILNLAINARDAMPEGGTLTLASHNLSVAADELPHGCDAAPGDYVRLSLSDTGVGMAPEVVQRAVEPFYSTKERASNSGLGLSSVAEFVRASSGFLTIDSEVGRGTTVSLFLPRFTGEAPVATSVGASDDVPLGDGELVLVVDDNERLLEASQALLEGLGYAVVTAGSGPRALEQLAMGEPVQLVLSDIVMPGQMSGHDIVRRIEAEFSHIEIVLASGHFDEQTVPDIVGDYTVLRKPFSRAALARALHAALAGSRQPADLADE